MGHKVEKNLQDEEIAAYLDVESSKNKVESIPVTGHSCCGGIRTLMNMEDEDNLSSFIKNWVVVGKAIYHVDNDISFEEEVVHQILRKNLTHVLELSSCIYLDDRAWGVLNFDSAGASLFTNLLAMGVEVRQIHLCVIFVCASSVEIFLLMELVRNAILELEIHSFMIQIQSLSMKFKAFLIHLHYPITIYTCVIYVKVIPIMAMNVRNESRLSMSQNRATIKALMIMIIHMTHQYSVNQPLNIQNELNNHEPFINELIQQKLQKENENAQLFLAIAITLDLPTVELEDSLRMGDEHIDTISETKSDEFINSSVENLVSSPSESEDEHKFVRDSNKTPDSSQRPPHDCLKCGNPVDGLHCRQCALLRKKLKEVWFTICDEHEFFQDFLNTSESSNDNTNIVNTPQEPFVFNQDPGENSSQSPPHTDHHCCYGCGDPLDDFLNTSEPSNNDFNVVNAPQEPIVFNQEPCEDSSQSPPQIDHQCFYGCGDSLNGFFCRRCTCESCGNGAHIGYNCPPKVPVVSNLEPYHNQNVDELPHTLTNFHLTCYSGGEDSFAHDSTPNFVNDSPNDRVSEIKNVVGNKQYKLNDVQELFRKLLNDVQNLHEELAKYISIPSWNYPTFSSHDDDDENYTIPITPEEPNNSLKFYDSNDDSTSIDDDYFSIDNIDYIELSPPDSELISLEEIEPDQGELTSVVILAEPRVHVPNVLTAHLTLMLDSDFIPFDNSLPEFEIFYFDIKEKNSGSTTIHADISLSDLECFNFKREPEPGELTSIVDSEIRENVLSATNVNLPPEDDHSSLFAYVVWIFLFFLTYPMVPQNLLSFGNEDTIFDLGISNYHFHSLLPDVSHRCGTFMKFNVYSNHLNECPMEILSSTTFPKDQ
nr:hypothetical protein [Tanacetum cinerariifolium]